MLEEKDRHIGGFLLNDYPLITVQIHISFYRFCRAFRYRRSVGRGQFGSDMRQGILARNLCTLDRFGVASSQAEGEKLVRLTHLQAHLEHSDNPSGTISTSSRRLRICIIPLPCYSDDSAYIVIDQTSNKAAVVDQYDNPEVVSAANGACVEVVGALTTHHYDDHCGGNRISRPFYLDRVTEGVGTGISNDPILPV